MSFLSKIDAVLAHHKEIENKLSTSNPSSDKNFIPLSKEFSDMQKLVGAINQYKQDIKESESLKTLLEDSDLDNEMREMAETELEEINKILPEKESKIKLLLIPKDRDDDRNAILEVRAGTGGDEAALFAADLFRMYCRYAENMGWKFEILSVSNTGIGGYKEAVLSISGSGVFARLKFESGVHRVQRVPETESSGRIHTSAATVAVLPEVEEFDIEIKDSDLRIDVFRASGPGGQSVNTTDSAVRIVHVPTGVTVQQQDEKSQHQNKLKAMKILRAKIYDMKAEEERQKRAGDRKSQVGSGDRSERIRTYNFPQGRVTDHRINLVLYKISEILDGSALDDIIEPLITNNQTQKLAQLPENRDNIVSG